MTTPSHVPTGNYPAPAPIHPLDLEATADRLLAKLPGHRRQTESLARESGTSIVMMAMEGGDEIKEHSAGGPVAIHILRGQIQLTAEGQTYDLRPNQLVFMQPDVRHDLHANTQAVVLLSISGIA